MTRVQSRLPLLILVAALLLVFHRLLLGEVFFWGLPSLQFAPWREYAFDLLRNGQLPLWNPYNGAGTPLFANYQSSLLYPFSWIGYLLPLALTMSVVAVLHLLIAGWGMWRFTGALQFSALGRGVSALAFAMSAYLVARLGTYPVIQAAAWLPWLLWAALRLLERGRFHRAGRLAIFTALLLLAGHAQTAWYSLLLVGFFAFWWTMHHRPLRLLRMLVVAGCLALGAGIASLQLIATAELLGQSQRSGGVDFGFAMNYSYAPARILNLFAPNVFGTPANGTYFTGGAFFEDAVYIGIIPLIGAIAALIGWVMTRRSDERSPAYTTTPFWLLVVVIGFVFALGVNTPIFPFLYNNVPTFDLFQGPVRWHLWTVFGLSTLAGIGVTVWGGRSSPSSRRLRRWALRLTVACFAAALLAVLYLIFAAPEIRAVGLLTQAVVAVGVLGVVAGVLSLTQPEAGTRGHGRWSLIVLVVVALDLAYAGWGLNPTVPTQFYDSSPVPDNFWIGLEHGNTARVYMTKRAEEDRKFEELFRFDDYRVATDQWREVRSTPLANLNILDRVPMLNNFEPLLVGHFAEYLDLVEADQFTHRVLLQAAGVGTVFYEPPNFPAPHAWLVTSVCWHETTDALKAAMTDANWQPYQQVQMLGDAGCSEPQVAEGSVEVAESEANQVVLSVDAARDSWVVLADTDYPGWVASVDGVETPIYRANLAFRAVQVDAGEHEVRFDYRPGWLLPGALVSAVSLLVALLLYRLRG
ncbi:MAG: YfhO family protein [Chloroflexota bacterium]